MTAHDRTHQVDFLALALMVTSFADKAHLLPLVAIYPAPLWTNAPDHYLLDPDAHSAIENRSYWIFFHARASWLG